MQTILEKLLLVVEQLFVSLGRELKIRTLNDGIDRTSFLAKATVNTLGHVDIVSGRSSTAIGSLLGFDGNSLS